MKNFFEWHKVKVKLENKENKEIYFYEREVWFTSCGINVGFEQDGKGEKFSRPVLIFKKFNQHVFWGIPLTKKCKEGRFYYTFQYKPQLKSSALLSQLKLFDAKRLLKKDGTISEKEYQNLRQKLKRLL